MVQLENNSINEPWIIDRTAISPYQDYCDGFVSPGAKGQGYVSVLKVATGVSDTTGDPILDGIVAYDRAESVGAYIGQINMITASSFSGLAGQIWGYDLAQHDDIRSGAAQPEFKLRQHDGSMIEFYDAGPLLDAGEELFGTVDKRRYPLVPGAHTICANKNVQAYRPAEGQPLKEGEAYGVWSFISIAIARNRDRDANLFIEDAGLWTQDDSSYELERFLENYKRRVAYATIDCGYNNRVLYDKVFIGYAYTIIPAGKLGMAITVGPYVTLAQKAVPPDGFDGLKRMTLKEWLSYQI